LIKTYICIFFSKSNLLFEKIKQRLTFKDINNLSKTKRLNLTKMEVEYKQQSIKTNKFVRVSLNLSMATISLFLFDNNFDQISVEKYFSLNTIIFDCWEIRSASSSFFLRLITTVSQEFASFSFKDWISVYGALVLDGSSFFFVL